MTHWIEIKCEERPEALYLGIHRVGVVEPNYGDDRNEESYWQIRCFLPGIAITNGSPIYSCHPTKEEAKRVLSRLVRGWIRGARF